MNPPGNSAGGETPPSSQNQTQLHWPGQTHVTANNESHIINEPSLPLNDAGGRRAPPSLPRPLEIEEPRQPPFGANQESHIINEQVPPPHHAIAGRRTPPSWPQLGIEEPRHIESPFISEPFLTYQEFLFINEEFPFINEEFLQPRRAADGIEAPHPQRLGIEQLRRIHYYLTYRELPFINEPFLTPHRAADGRRTHPSPSSQRQIGIQDPGQPLSRVNNESLTIRQPSPPLYFAGRGTRLQTSRYQFILRYKKEQLLRHQQHALRVNQESHTIKKLSPPLYSAGQRTSSRALKDQPLQYQQHPLRVNQESHTMKKLSSSSKDRRGGVVARRCGNCNNTSTTLWRSDPTGQKSLCNACGIRLNREEEIRAASGLQASNVSSAALRRHLEEVRNRVEPMENNANPFVLENNFLGPSSGLQPSNIVPPPPAAPSLANRVQHVENISGLQSSPPLRDPPEEAVTKGNVIAAVTNFSAGRNKVDQSQKRAVHQDLDLL
ncbi:hypothetical protein K1719_020350 [Acacia pycnantha]|nr:hypothetical protein K1719_020350 [Acacia pycnantha]